MPKTTLQLTAEAQRIADNILIKSVNLDSADVEILVLALSHTITELQSAIESLKRNKVPKELAGVPATLALLSSLVIMNNEPATVAQFKAFLKNLERVT
jgi:hypothetical protein